MAQGPSVSLPKMPVHNVAAGTVREVMPEDMVLAQGEMGAVTRAVSSTEDAERLNWYLRAILTANVYDVAVESALDYAPRLSEKVGAKIHLKREDLQPVKSFKLRGAYNRMAAISPEALEKGVICSSAGNHAQGVALAAKELGCNAVIAMPVTTPAIKVDAVRQLGATVALEGENYDACQAYAKARAETDGRTFVPPFDDPLVVAGQGTVGMEIVRQLPGVEVIFVPVGGGGVHRGHRRVRQEHPPGRQGDRRRARGRQRHGAVAVPWRDLPAGQGGRLRRRRRRAAGRARCASTCASSWWTA